MTFLALHQHRALPRSYVAGVLWADVPSDRAGANLRASIWRLPQQCRALIEQTARHIRLAENVAVDYIDAVSVAHRLLDDGQCREADLGREARSQMSSELLPACYDEWVLIERERFRQLRIHALEAQCERLTISERYAEAIDAGLAATRAEPLRESSHRVLIKAHLAEGNTSEARRQYEFYCEMLHDELGVEPSDGLRSLVPVAVGRR
jgi:DNA-binding SARP family transcriptional activator